MVRDFVTTKYVRERWSAVSKSLFLLSLTAKATCSCTTGSRTFTKISRSMSRTRTVKLKPASSMVSLQSAARPPGSPLTARTVVFFFGRYVRVRRGNSYRRNRNCVAKCTLHFLQSLHHRPDTIVCFGQQDFKYKMADSTHGCDNPANKDVKVPKCYDCTDEKCLVWSRVAAL